MIKVHKAIELNECDCDSDTDTSVSNEFCIEIGCKFRFSITRVRVPKWIQNISLWPPVNMVHTVNHLNLFIHIEAID